MPGCKLSGLSLSAAGLIALADLKSIAYRTALRGTSSYFDILFLAPGIHCQQDASEVNKGEYPATGSMITGYVFRVENQATVNYLQRVGASGHLVNVKVSSRVSEHGLPSNTPLCASCSDKLHSKSRIRRSACLSCHAKRCSTLLFSRDALASVIYALGLLMTIVVLYLLIYIRDWWGVGVVAMLIVARLCNVVVIRRRTTMGWKGAPEPGVWGDLFILLSQDRWVRIRGLVDDLKIVTAGQWLKEETAVESFIVSVGTLLVYASAALAGNSSTVGNLLIACLLLISVALLAVCNSLTETQHMFGRTLCTDGEPPEPYQRRLDLANKLIKEVKRDDWAIRMGLIVPEHDKVQKAVM
ncbi:hypothetical protein NEOLEDRAFT_1163877 [Neolentinus lepideus HHB14362 ss-1]|uniref:Uncharacterized protein n=1 Tax=Neolentinus lepideus HHB14362 ss-1 TaxID=1314782 RepID=A0A165QWZ5_9AGAM|nr:hypothetical protein NEOLEDRAFT_1163877 [Neolentinus lepideus HHB14362 ss-1]